MTTLTGIVAAGVLTTAPAARAGDTADIALVAALDGAPVPTRKPDPAARAGTVPVPPPVPPAYRTAADTDPDAGPDAGPAVGGVAPGVTLASLSTTPEPNHPGDADLDIGADHPPAPVQVAARVDRGDTLIGLLTDAGVDRVTAHQAVQAMEEVFDPRHMRPGHVVNIGFTEPENGDLRFLGFDFEPTPGTRVVVSAAPDAGAGFAAGQVQEPLEREVVRYGGPITLSLYQAAVDAGVSEGALSDMVRILSYDVDFQRDIQKDDTFEIMYERFTTADGRHVRDGQIQFLALTNNGRRIAAYAFETDDGFINYFDEAGHGVRKPLMRTPIDGARLSSSFGMRRHPILGYSRMHTGVDFAAPSGTPIYAAGDGVVRFAGRKGGYGNYVQIRHNSEFATAYAHMSRILVRNGERVEQGDVIGRVGSTGRSTGPHLHYEIIRNGQKVNPLDVRFPPAIILAGAELNRFESHRVEVDRLYASLRAQTEIASTRGADAPRD
jgi:murein DD-endopeptidase MepM/ murein hydrolase activator NlpD